MPNVASVLKSEMSRVARKEVRAATESMKQSASTQRTEIAALKRRIDALEKHLRQLSKTSAKAAPATASADGGEAGLVRFSAKGMASHRRRLDLSAADLGRLIGVSPQTIYNWEQGISRPLARYRDAIVGLRSIGKRQVDGYLATLE